MMLSLDEFLHKHNLDKDIEKIKMLLDIQKKQI